MRVSKTFYEVTGPLLYRNIVINNEYPALAITAGDSLVGRRATRQHAAAFNLKTKLLSLTQNLVIASHLCTGSSFAGALLDVHTLLIDPSPSCGGNNRLCNSMSGCPILAKVRPQKVVLYHTRYCDHLGNLGELIHHHSFTVQCPTLTLVLDETGCGEARLRDDMQYRDVELPVLKHLRIIVQRTPERLELESGEDMSSINQPFDIGRLVSRMLKPVIAPIVTLGWILVTVYIFHQLDTKSLEALTIAIDTQLGERNAVTGMTVDGSQKGRPLYIIKTLSDFISEGLTDELVPQELRYWRGVNQTRMAKAEAEAGRSQMVDLA